MENICKECGIRLFENAKCFDCDWSSDYYEGDHF